MEILKKNFLVAWEFTFTFNILISIFLNCFLDDIMQLNQRESSIHNLHFHKKNLIFALYFHQNVP